MSLLANWLQDRQHACPAACRISSCCAAIVCSAISVSWSAMARLSLAACARLALTCSEIMIDSCGRFRMRQQQRPRHRVEARRPGRGSATTRCPTVMPRKTYIDPQNLFTPSAILSRTLLPRTCSDSTSLGWNCSGACLISAAFSCRWRSSWLDIAQRAARRWQAWRTESEPDERRRWAPWMAVMVASVVTSGTDLARELTDHALVTAPTCQAVGLAAA